MSAQEPPSEPPSSSNKPDDASTSESAPLLAEHNDDGDGSGDASMDISPDQPPEETWDDIPEDVRNAGVEEIITRARLIDNDIRVCIPFRLLFYFTNSFICNGILYYRSCGLNCNGYHTSKRRCKRRFVIMERR